MLPDESDPRHGTNAGHRAHYESNGDKTPCDPCRAAHAEYKRQLWRRKYAMRVSDLYVPSIGTTRRIRALQAIGWRLSDIDQALGHGDGRKGGPNYAHNLTRQDRIHASTAAKVARVYEQMSMTPGPSARTRSIAKKRKWAPPLAWNNIDDPNEKPTGMVTVKAARRPHDELDLTVVERLLEGQKVPQTTNAERKEAMRRWLAMGNSERSLCKALGWKDGRYLPRDEDAA